MHYLATAASWGWSTVSWGASLGINALATIPVGGTILGQVLPVVASKEIDDQNLKERLTAIAKRELHISPEVSFSEYRKNDHGTFLRVIEPIISTGTTGSNVIPSSRLGIVVEDASFFLLAKRLYALSCEYPLMKEGVKLSTLFFSTFAPVSLTLKAAVALTSIVGLELLSRKIEHGGDLFALKHASANEIAEYIRYLNGSTLYRIWSCSQMRNPLFSHLYNYAANGTARSVKSEILFLVGEYEKRQTEPSCDVSVGTRYFERHKNDPAAARIQQQVKKHASRYPSHIGFTGIAMDPDADEKNFFFTYDSKVSLPHFFTVPKAKIQRFLNEPSQREATLLELIDDAINGPRYCMMHSEDCSSEILNSEVDGKRVSIAQLRTRFVNVKTPKCTPARNDEEYLLVCPDKLADRKGYEEFLLK